MTPTEVDAKPGRPSVVNIHVGSGRIIEKAPRANCGYCGAYLGGEVASVAGALKWVRPPHFDRRKNLLLMTPAGARPIRRPQLVALPVRFICGRCGVVNVVGAGAFNSVVLESIESGPGRESASPGPQKLRGSKPG